MGETEFFEFFFDVFLFFFFAAVVDKLLVGILVLSVKVNSLVFGS